MLPGDDLYLTIDHDLHPGQPPLDPAGSEADDEAAGPGNLEDRLGDSDDALIGAARTQMLAHLALRSRHPTAHRARARRPRFPWHRRSGLTTPLEEHGLTHGMRADARGTAADSDQHTLRAGLPSMGLDDFLSCRITGTGVHLGMSRKLPAACERLHEEDLAVARRTQGLRAEDQPPADLELSDEAPEEQLLAQRRIFREQQEEARPRLRAPIYDAYERGAAWAWSDLLRCSQEPELDLEGDKSLLEAATPETYVAVSRYDLAPALAWLFLTRRQWRGTNRPFAAKRTDGRARVDWSVGFSALRYSPHTTRNSAPSVKAITTIRG
ncbi:hypothetical protein ACIP2Y_44260 [Streptomyces sviceus]|uniref:hypothetical protein n=1 Tax=Streptomyces sviceus TaxID=285530 RepID=UPI00380E6F5D